MMGVRRDGAAVLRSAGAGEQMNAARGGVGKPCGGLGGMRSA